MNRKHNPSAIAPPAGRYTHGIEVPPGARWLHVSGQVGRAPDGSTPNTIGGQTENCFRNISAVLAEAGMSFADVVKLTILLTRDGDIPSFRMDHMPYGGVKESGTGREGLKYAIEDMTERRLLVMNV